MIRAYSSDIINNKKTPEVPKTNSGNKVIYYETTLGEWKIQLTETISFISSKDSDEIGTMHTKKIIQKLRWVRSETNEITKELFKSLLQTHQEGLEESLKGSEFVFDSAGLLEYKLNKISLNKRRSFVDSP